MAKPLLKRSYLHVPRTVPFTDLTVAQKFYEAVEKFADREMYVFYGDKERITFKEMKNQVSVDMAIYSQHGK